MKKKPPALQVVFFFAADAARRMNDFLKFARTKTPAKRKNRNESAEQEKRRIAEAKNRHNIKYLTRAKSQKIKKSKRQNFIFLSFVSECLSGFYKILFYILTIF